MSTFGQDLFAAMVDAQRSAQAFQSAHPTEFHRVTQEQLAEVLEGEPHWEPNQADLDRMNEEDILRRSNRPGIGRPHEL